MKNARFQTAIVFASNLLITCLLVSSVLASSSLGESWPQYRGPQGNGKSSDSLGNVQNLKTVWKVPTQLGFSSFSVAKGRAFTQVQIEDMETLLALDASTGDTLWTKKLGLSDWRGGGGAGAPDNKGGDGPRSTPSTDGTHVFVYDAHLALTCFDAAKGSLLWKQDVMADFGGRNIKWHNATSPLLDGNRVFVGGGGADQSFLAFDKNDGSVIWKSGDEEITHATPTLTEIDGKKQIIFFVQSGLVSIDPENGKELWRQKYDFSVSTAASPIADGNMVYCSAGYGVGAGLYEISDNSDSSRVWRKPSKLMNHWSTPVVHDGHLYGIFEFKKYGKAPLNCVELKTGKIKWSKRGFGPGNVILVGNKLVVLSDAGELVFVSAQSDEYEELGRQEVLAGKCWSTPAYADGKLFVRSTEEGACLEVAE